MLGRLCLVAAALGVASGFPTALTCGERELEVGGPKIMGIVPYESERTLMVMRANGEMLSDGDTIAPSEKLTVKVSDTAGQVQLRAEGHGAWGEAACTDGGDGGVSCINNEWETTLCTYLGRTRRGFRRAGRGGHEEVHTQGGHRQCTGARRR
jgi:hypothetical protein